MIYIQNSRIIIINYIKRKIKNYLQFKKINIPERALYIYDQRADLKKEFNIKSKKGKNNYINWYINHAFKEMALEFDHGDQAMIDVMGLTCHSFQIKSFLPITLLMKSFIGLFPDRFERKNPESHEKFLSWFFAYALAKFNLLNFLTSEQIKVLLSSKDGACQAVANERGWRLFHCIWISSPDLHVRFNGPDDPDFRTWCVSAEGVYSFPILAHPAIALAELPARGPINARPFGVNLFGHVNARSGISEDVRMASRTLEAAGIPFVVRNIPPGAAMPEEDMVASSENAMLPYAINMFCMPAPSTAAAILSMGRERMRDYHTIGFWPWELPEMPQFWRHAYDFVDEIWASTHFTYSAFCRSSPRPVRQVPFLVEASESDGKSRQDFGLPESRFLFGFAFDGLSGFARKAPLVAIRAFQRAFRSDDYGVGLVLKGLRVDADPAWRQVVDAIGNDPRIHIVTASLTRGSLLDLWRSLDCFLSLHRSEGFGRNIAEAMLLGKPVIVTAHSGNMDFTDHETAALVACSLRPVTNGEYPFGEGQLWAEPDIESAAVQMRRMLEDANFRNKFSSDGMSFIKNNYNINNVSTRWKISLKSIYS